MHRHLVLFLWFRLVGFLHLDLLLKIRSFGLDFFQARPSHSKHLCLSFRSVHLNLTAAFLKVSLTSGNRSFPFHVLVRSCWTYNMKYSSYEAKQERIVSFKFWGVPITGGLFVLEFQYLRVYPRNFGWTLNEVSCCEIPAWKFSSFHTLLVGQVLHSNIPKRLPEIPTFNMNSHTQDSDVVEMVF